MTNSTETLPTLPREDEEVADLIASLPKQSLADTLNALSDFYRRFLYHPDDSTYDLCALWAAHTHSMFRWRATPRIFIVAPEPGCGKTLQAEMLLFGSRNGIMAATTSTAGLFNIASTHTVFLDETDNLFSSHSERKVLTSILNAGYKPGGNVVRKNGIIPVYGALAFAGIENGTMPEPTRQRCIPVQMHPGIPAEHYDPFDHIAYHDEVVARLTDAADSWDYVKPETVNRENELWSPLRSIAIAAGGDWPQRVDKAQQVHQWPSEANEQNAILRATHQWFAEHKEERVSSAVLAEYINADDTLPNVTAKGLAGRMKGYHVYPRKISLMYYYKEDFAPVWAKWL